MTTFLSAVISSRNYLYILPNISHMQISLTQDANAGKLRSFSLTGGSLCLQGWSCYAQTLHLQSKLIDSYTLHLLCLWWCQRIRDIPVIIAQCHRSQPHLMWGSLLLCLSLQGIGPSLLQCPQSGNLLLCKRTYFILHSSDQGFLFLFLLLLTMSLNLCYVMSLSH